MSPEPKRRRWPLRLANAAATLLLVAVVAALVVVVAPGVFGFKTYVVRSGSMEPNYPTGSLAFTKPRPPTELDVGDVAVLRHPQRRSPSPVMHRIVTVDRSSGPTVVQTKGDTNPAPDPDLVRVDRAPPVVAGYVPYLGYAVAAVTTPMGWAAAFIVPAAALCAVVLWRIWWPEPAAAPEPAAV